MKARLPETEMTDAQTVAPPSAQFNFAEHLLQRNVGRGSKLAYIDDLGTLSYGELAQRVRKFAVAQRTQVVDVRELAADAGLQRLAGELSRRDVRRAGAGGREHAADG
jgi:hypothetical protein